MAFVVNFAKTLRNHWKKSIFFTGCAIFGVNYANDRYDEELMRREFCEKAKKYGNVPVQMNEKLKRVTVFLNPAGRNGKVRKLFEKNAAPILHLAGFEVNIVKTEGQGQAKDFMSVIDSSDADVIVVAGGDGTVSEVITGLLRRVDQTFIDRTPISILPLGHTNSLARLLFTNTKNDVRWILDAAMAIVENTTKKVDVMSITGDEGKTVYTVSHMQWGAYRDTDVKKSKFWFFGGLKDRMTYLIVSAIQRWPPTLNAQLSYVLPCEGCSRCFQMPVKVEVPWKWWHTILPPVQRPVTKTVKDYSQIVNEECGQVHTKDITTMELSVLSSNYQGDEDAKSLSLSLAPDYVTRTQFIKEGCWTRHWRCAVLTAPLLALYTPQGAEIDVWFEQFRSLGNRWKRIRQEHPKIRSESDDILHVQEFRLEPQMLEEDTMWFTSDSENYEAMPIDVKLLKNKLTVFCSNKESAATS